MNAHRLSIPEAEIRGAGRYHFHTGIIVQLRNVFAACESINLAKRLLCRRFLNAGSLMEYDVMKYLPQDGAEPTAAYIYGISKMTADFMLKTLAVREGIEYQTFADC